MYNSRKQFRLRPDVIADDRLSKRHSQASFRPIRSSATMQLETRVWPRREFTDFDRSLGDMVDTACDTLPRCREGSGLTFAWGTVCMRLKAGTSRDALPPVAEW